MKMGARLLAIGLLAALLAGCGGAPMGGTGDALEDHKQRLRKALWDGMARAEILSYLYDQKISFTRYDDKREIRAIVRNVDNVIFGCQTHLLFRVILDPRNELEDLEFTRAVQC